MSIVDFQPAVRKGSHVIIVYYGESGCGKTLSAIKTARGLVGPNGRFAVLDTENERALVYAKEAGGWLHANLTPPFTPDRYIQSIKTAEDAGFECLVIDSGSHEWEGLGGILEMADGNGQRGLVKWAGPKAAHKRYVQALLQTRMHLIICLRAKEKVRQLTAADTLPPGRKVSPQPRASTWLISSPSLVLPSRMVASVIGSGGAAMRRALSTARLTAYARLARQSPRTMVRRSTNSWPFTGGLRRSRLRFIPGMQIGRGSLAMQCTWLCPGLQSSERSDETCRI
jgi:hypothetical protein